MDGTTMLEAKGTEANMTIVSGNGTYVTLHTTDASDAVSRGFTLRYASLNNPQGSYVNCAEQALLGQGNLTATMFGCITPGNGNEQFCNYTILPPELADDKFIAVNFLVNHFAPGDHVEVFQDGQSVSNISVRATSVQVNAAPGARVEVVFRGSNQESNGWVARWSISDFKNPVRVHFQCL